MELGKSIDFERDDGTVFTIDATEVKPNHCIMICRVKDGRLCSMAIEIKEDFTAEKIKEFLKGASLAIARRIIHTGWKDNEEKGNSIWKKLPQ